MENKAYNNSNNPFILSLPHSLEEGEKAEAVVAVRLTDEAEVILPISIYEDEEVKFFASSTGRYDFINNEKEFNDTNTHWAKDYISFVSARELFVGTGNDNFSPNDTMTRAMFIAVLSRLDQANLDIYTSSRFLDVQNDSWYMASIEWASLRGIIKNARHTDVEPNAALTREEMAIIFYNYILFKGYTLNEIEETIAFDDSNLLSEEGAIAVEIMQRADVINGKLNNLFDPYGIATRAEVSTMFKKFVEALNK